MATRSYEFVGPMLQAQHSIRNDLGSDIMTADPQTYAINLEILSLIAMTLKCLQDAVPLMFTDANLQQRLNAAIDTGPNGDRSGWPGWILLQIPPTQLSLYGATLADSPAVLRAKIDAYNAGGGA